MKQKESITGLLRNAIFRHPERSEGSCQRRDSSAFSLRMTAKTEFRNSPITDLIPQGIIENKIFMLRGKRVMLDRDLAKLYGVSTGNLNKAVKRNIERFPGDFMLQLTKDEEISLRFHFGSLKKEINL